MRRFVVIATATAALLASMLLAPGPQESAAQAAAAAPQAVAAVHGCEIASAYPGGYPVCGYHQDGPWTFRSGRSVTCWAGIQFRDSDNNYRYWAKCHAKGVHGTIVDAYYHLQIVNLHRYVLAPFDWDGLIATGCPSSGGGCPKTGKDVYWVGAKWRPHPGSQYGILADYEVWAHIQGTNDETSTHCVSSDVWAWVYYNNRPGIC
jgi:hypothetical protein